jgi:hypothetical protein
VTDDDADDVEQRYQDIDKALQHWRQGDCVIDKLQFVHRHDPDLPLTAKADTGSNELISTAVHGFAVVTQTCDIVRACTDRPFIEIAPLVKIEESRHLDEIRFGRRPRYAFISGVADVNLVADLDRVMTVEKTVVAKWQRTSGCQNDTDANNLRHALARKRIRFAFPDDFGIFVKRLHDRLQKKHDKDSDEGRALRALQEIRVRAAPSWDADSVELTFWFIRGEDQPNFEGKEWYEWLENWLNLLPVSGRFQADGQVVTLDDLTARDYLESDSLDLDHLTLRFSQK